MDCSDDTSSGAQPLHSLKRGTNPFERIRGTDILWHNYLTDHQCTDNTWDNKTGAPFGEGKPNFGFGCVHQGGVLGSHFAWYLLIPNKINCWFYGIEQYLIEYLWESLKFHLHKQGLAFFEWGPKVNEQSQPFQVLPTFVASSLNWTKAWNEPSEWPLRSSQTQ